MTTYDEKLEAYGEEIYQPSDYLYPLTLDELIDSHRSMREMNKKYHKEWHDALSQAREMGKQQGYEAITNGEYFHKDALKAMTLLEISNLLADVE